MSSVVAPAAARSALAARTGVVVVFALNGFVIGSWFARVPGVREVLDLSASRLGLLLLAMSVGAVVAMPVAGLVVQRLGTARTVMVAALTLSVGLLVAGVCASAASWPPGVAVGLFVFGYGTGTCDVAMNIEGAAVERRLGRAVMPRFHAAWSLGSVAGAGLGAVAAEVGLAVAVHLPLVGGAVLVGMVFGARGFLPAAQTTSVASKVSRATRRRALLAAWREPRTLLIGLFVLVAAFSEGSATDWIAIAFVDGYGVSEAAGAAVFGMFVVGMTIGRTAGTLALDRWGRVPVLGGAILLAVVGVSVAVLADSEPVAAVGVALWGLGGSLSFPVGMSAAADEEERAPVRVSVVAAIGYTAFLADPPLLGLIGERIGTLHALLVVPIVLLLSVALVPATRPPRGHHE
ncbi:MFS transporter [Salinispora tropica]|uniref:Major facilitator superfamily MFS_1 n=1 Tax=Salinispora tropica (strain ATCC BAA-916 / DSM 44818 / JCM 13857 / NBRC 105044 / CNB-440) TaxID=369723 RepID=A4X7Y1_SALTO|nr:MFS transporter [Salinispora tropica]ABP54981.1 major facilitator superfamily MFS_1 [Salinispora tropica CNB-440]